MTGQVLERGYQEREKGFLGKKLQYQYPLLLVPKRVEKSEALVLH
jgi:hypothetical protein